jgi:WD40 repeat protein
MSMEQEYIVHDTHIRPITAVGCSPARREIYLGFEDGVVKSIELDTGNHVQTYNEHKGWITSFLFWPSTKLLICSSNDSVISVIGAGGNIMDKIFIGVPVYSMALSNRRKEIVFGVANGLQFHQLFETKEGFSHYIEAKPNFVIREHSDIVRSVVVLDSRIYSGGYDGALVIYECQYTGKESASKFFKNTRAHDAGISCLCVEKDAIENNIWVFTGGFDKTLKIWTGDYFL